MSKFCMQCGSEIDENSTVCSSCGAAQTNVESNGAFTNAITPKKFDVKIIAAAAVVVVILLVLLKALFGGSYKDPIDNMCKAMETGKGKYIYACLPDFYIDEEYEDMKKKEIIEELDEQAEDIYDSLEDEVGKKVKVSYKIKDKEKIDKDDLEDMQEMFEDAYESKVKIRKGYEVKVKIKIKGKDDSNSETVTLNVYQINGDWCILGLGGLF